MKFARSHDGESFVIYLNLDNAPDYVHAYMKIVLTPNKAHGLYTALKEYMAEHEPVTTAWLPGATDG